MSHFQCPECGANILEGPTGEYITSCEHYPLKKEDGKTTAFTKYGKEWHSDDFALLTLIEAARDTS